MSEYRVFQFKKLEFNGNWRLDWGSQGQARYKPREYASILITSIDGTVENITPASNDVVVVERNVIHIPTTTNQ
ncbi:MAG: hypothetical protein O3C48_08135 [Crenarchaeota archaeon]|nr:hypothetical protein [Thermoproteota archaeon]